MRSEQHASLLLGVVLVAVVSATITTVLLRSEPTRQTTAERVELRDRRIEELARELEELEISLSQLSAITELTSAPEGISREELESLIRQLIDTASTTDDATPGDATAEGLDLAFLHGELIDPEVDPSSKQRIWAELRESNQLDAMIGEFERHTEDRPEDSRVWTELGWAYFQKMVSVGGGPEAGRWGSQGSDALVRAIDLDAMNWDARFTLARHYSYAQMGGDAIRHLEVLVKQQDRRPALDKHARAFLLLGNLYLDRGRNEKAREIWSDGANRFPDDAAIRRRLETLD